MTKPSKVVFRDIVESALQELADAAYQQRVWVQGSQTEMSSMTEAVEALFSDSCLGVALEKNEITFSQDADAELRKLRVMLRSSLADEEMQGVEVVINSAKWKRIRDSAAHVLKLLVVRH